MERCIVRAPMDFQYVALSYVWGYSGGTLTPCSNLVDGILPSNLSGTIEDTITVTIEMGFRYLCIDKYCIDQSAEGPALLKQLSAMDLYYSRAALTIIAASGDDAQFGLPGVGKQLRIQQPSIAVNGITWVSGSRNMQAPIRASKWMTRGWTYHEEHFSRRRLYFTNEQVLFECNTCKRCESMHFKMDKGSQIPTLQRRIRLQTIWTVPHLGTT